MVLSTPVKVLLIGGAGLAFYTIGAQAGLGPLQGLYNDTFGHVHASVGVSTAHATALPPAGAAPNTAFIPGVQYVAAAAGGGYVVVTHGVNKGTFNNLSDAQNAYNALIASGG